MRYYLVPVVGDGSRASQGPLRPKYFLDWDAEKKRIVPLIADGDMNFLHHGREPIWMVAANTTEVEHAAIVANSDVIATPADLHQHLGSDLAALRLRLEALNIPTDHFRESTTWRVAFRWITKLFTFHTRYHGFANHRPFFVPGITVDHTVADLAIAHLREAAESFGATLPHGVKHDTPLRDILKHVTDQLPGSTMTGEL